ncbi:MAG: PfaD family polyunsaturated fatty acid/polyketide biosynthesis protein [Desulfobacterales bacterium]
MGISSSAALVRPAYEGGNPQRLWGGQWVAQGPLQPFDSGHIREALLQGQRPIFIVKNGPHLAMAGEGRAIFGPLTHRESDSYPIQAWAPALSPESLGEPSFKAAHGLKYAYLAGAMANGITSVAMVAAMARAGMLGVFGSAGMAPAQVEAAIEALQEEIPNGPLGFNLIHSPFDPQLEMALVDLYLRRGIRRISASAYINLTLPLVYYRLKGIHRDATGQVVCPNRLIAKISRIEVAQRFLSPPPPKMVAQLRQQNYISEGEAQLAGEIPMADDLTAEADSGGHTDNRPALALLPTLLALRDQLQEAYGYRRRPCVGLGGGIATPQAAAAAFAMGAAFVVVGTVNQSCLESGTSARVRQLLAAARQGDVTMAPSADMFELGVKVQVLKRGTMFPLRAHKLYDLYHRYDAFEQIPADQRQIVERDIFQADFHHVWRETQAFFSQRDPRQIERAQGDLKHRMALVFRSYLGQSSKWAQAGDPQRQMDYQVWCGPAMGAFNQWVQGSFLEDLAQRTVTVVAINFLLGAAYLTRASLLSQQGVRMPDGAARFTPLAIDEMEPYLARCA